MEAQTTASKRQGSSVVLINLPKEHYTEQPHQQWRVSYSQNGQFIFNFADVVNLYPVFW